MKPISHLLSSICFLLCSCQGPIKYTASNGSKSETFQTWGMVGGSESFRTAGGMEWTGNRNKSFGQAAQTATAVAAGHFAAAQNASNNAASTAAGAQSAATQQAKIAADEAVLIEQIKAGVAP